MRKILAHLGTTKFNYFHTEILVGAILKNLVTLIRKRRGKEKKFYLYLKKNGMPHFSTQHIPLMKKIIKARLQ